MLTCSDPYAPPITAPASCNFPPSPPPPVQYKIGTQTENPPPHHAWPHMMMRVNN